MFGEGVVCLGFLGVIFKFCFVCGVVLFFWVLVVCFFYGSSLSLQLLCLLWLWVLRSRGDGSAAAFFLHSCCSAGGRVLFV